MIGGILVSHIEHATHTVTHTRTHTHTCRNQEYVSALAGADATMRTVISPTVAVATPTRGKSLIVCAHACACVLVIVTEA